MPGHRRLQQAGVEPGGNSSSSSTSGGNSSSSSGGSSGSSASQLEPPAAAAPQQPAPVLLGIAYGGPAVTALPGQPDIIDASAVNTTRCIRYAAGFEPGGGAAAPGGGAAAGGGPRYVRPPLDLAACQQSVLDVFSAIQRVLVEVRGGARRGRRQPAVDFPRMLALRAACTSTASPPPPLATLQVRINAFAAELPPDALQLTAGEVLSVGQPFVDGPFQVWHITVSLAAPDRPCNVTVPDGALTGEVGEPTAASNTLRITWKTQGPQVRWGGSWRCSCTCLAAAAARACRPSRPLRSTTPPAPLVMPAAHHWLDWQVRQHGADARAALD